MKSILRKEVIIGLLVIVAMLILFFGINFLKGVNLFKAANYYYSVYNNVEGLAQSAPVTLNGYKVGIVRSINYDFSRPGNVIVEMSLDKSLKLPKGTEAVLGSDLLGTASITLTLGNAPTYLYAVGDTIPGKVKAGMMAGISENLMPAMNSIMPKIDSLLTNLNALTANPALHQSVTRLDDITTGLIALEIQMTMANLRQLSESLNNPNSSIGKLTNDPALYDNINATITSLDSLFIDIKKNPKRYINIKVF